MTNHTTEIVAAAARTAIGETLTESFVSLRAGVCRLSRTKYRDCQGNSFAAAPIFAPAATNEADPWASGRVLVRSALEELGCQLDTVGLKRDRVFLALGVPRMSGLLPKEAGLDDKLNEMDRGRESVFEVALDYVRDRWGTPIDAEGHVGFTCGPATAAQILERVVVDLDAGKADAYIFGGVAVPCSGAWLTLLEQLGFTPLRDKRSGVVPGETVGLVVLRRSAPATGSIRLRRLSNAPTAAGHDQALTTVMNAVLDAGIRLPEREIDVWLDSNGLLDQTKGYYYAGLRALGTRKLVGKTREPASHLGDVGLATLPLYLGFAAKALTTHKAGSQLVVLGHPVGDDTCTAALVEQDYE